MALALALFSCASTVRAGDPAREAADLYQEGRREFQDGRFERARVAFEGALSRFSSPNARLYLGRALRELGRLAEAAEAFERAKAEAARHRAADPDYAKTEEAAGRELADVARRIAWLTVHVVDAHGVGKEGEVSIEGGRVLPTAHDGSLRFATLPGEVRITVKGDGAGPTLRRIAAAPGDDRTIVVALTPLEVTRHGPSPLVFVSGGVALASFAGFGMLQLAAADRFATLKERDCHEPFTAECSSARSAGPTFEAFSFVALGVGVVALGATIVLAVSSKDAPRKAAASPCVVHF